MLPVRDRNPAPGPAPVTRLLILLNVAAFLVQIRLLGAGPALTLMEVGAFVPQRFLADPLGFAPSLLLHAFLHADPLHLAGNLFFLAVFGDDVEVRLGRGRYLAFYLAGAVAAAGVHAAFEPSGWRPLVGASGAIGALLAAYVVWFPRSGVQAYVFVLAPLWWALRLVGRPPHFYLWWLPAWAYVGWWAVVQGWQAVGTLTVRDVAAPGVAWWAHVGGFAFGIAVAALARRRRSAG